MGADDLRGLHFVGRESGGSSEGSGVCAVGVAWRASRNDSDESTGKVIDLMAGY